MRRWVKLVCTTFRGVRATNISREATGRVATVILPSGSILGTESGNIRVNGEVARGTCEHTVLGIARCGGWGDEFGTGNHVSRAATGD